MFYSDLRREPLSTRLSHYILRFHTHYTEYINGVFVRSVDYSAITLQ